jgi:hypothetical protein
MHKNPTRQNATKILVIASKATGLVRRYIDADNDHEYVHHEYRMHPGETALYLTHQEYDSFDNVNAFHDHIAKKMGFEGTPNMRHVVLNPQGLVVKVCLADPSCGDSGDHFGEQHQLVKHEFAEVGEVL